MCTVDVAAGNNEEAKSEELLARMFKEDLGVRVEPQAMRMFVRSRWERLTTLAHRIHEGKR